MSFAPLVFARVTGPRVSAANLLNQIPTLIVWRWAILFFSSGTSCLTQGAVLTFSFNVFSHILPPKLLSCPVQCLLKSKTTSTEFRIVKLFQNCLYECLQYYKLFLCFIPSFHVPLPVQHAISHFHLVLEAASLPHLLLVLLRLPS